MPKFDLERKFMQIKSKNDIFLFWNNIAKFNNIKLFQNKVLKCQVHSIGVDRGAKHLKHKPMFHH